ncbi:MAG: hypothetical protein ACLP62_11075, partial [Acidimicrobiales bacterium]
AAENASRLGSNIPVLYIAGSDDPLTIELGKGFIFDKLPKQPESKYMLVNADHLGTPKASVKEMINWLRTVFPQ